MKYMEIKKNDTANGMGVRTSLFVSGCTHCCKGCFNQSSWDFNNGLDFTLETISEIINSMKNDYIHGLTLLGGEPLDPRNQKMILLLIMMIKSDISTSKKTIWCYTGYTFEELMKRPSQTTQDILCNIDVLVDGKFDINQKDLRLKFRGSKNQRIIDMRKSLKKGEIILYEKI